MLAFLLSVCSSLRYNVYITLDISQFFQCTLNTTDRSVSYTTLKPVVGVTVPSSSLLFLCVLLLIRLLHFARVVDDAKCILVSRVCLSVCLCVCVCLSFAACPHYCTDQDVTWGMVGGARRCTILGGFAIGARVSLL